MFRERRSAAPAVLCFAIHIWVPESYMESVAQISCAHFNICHQAHGTLTHTHTLGHCPERRGKGWVMANGWGVSIVTRVTEGRGGPPADPHWEVEWLSLSRGKGSQWHTMLETSARERATSSRVSPSWLRPDRASAVSLRHLTLASERHYANSIKGGSPHLCISCANPRAQQDFYISTNRSRPKPRKAFAWRWNNK